MPEWQPETFRQRVTKLSDSLRGVSSRRKAVVAFAKHHQLIYFQSVPQDSESVPVIRGSTVSPDQVDANYCIGSHADYDMAFVERTSRIAHEGFKTTMHRWYVLQIDLRTAQNLPFIFVGTRQQTKAYYAQVLTTHREIRYLSLDSASPKSASFHSHYALLASPAELPALYRLFTDEMIDTMATHHYPFAIEIDGDSLTVITEAIKPSQQLLDKLLHYGLWVAKAVDSRLA